MSERIVCFIHSCNLPTWGTESLIHLLSQIEVTGLYERLEYLFINNIGTPIPAPFPGFEKAIVTNYSTDTNLFENCTLRQMVFFAQFNPDVKILYLHTKGISHPRGSPHLIGIRGWIDFMLYGLVHHAPACLRMLDFVDTVGLNFRHRYFEKNGNHYSGNFWWVQSNYLRTMPIHELRDKHDAEFWLFRNQPRYINIHSCPHGHYERYYPPEEYQSLVAAKVVNIVEMLASIRSLPIFYGVEGKYLDVTEVCQERLCSAGTLTIPPGDFERNDLFTDPVPGVYKHIRVGNLTYGIREELRVPYGEI